MIGKPINRIEGPLKVCGAATYTAEFDIHAAYGFLVCATIGCGKLKNIDDAAARRVTGVVDVFTDLQNFIAHPQQGGEETAPRQGVSDIVYRGEAVAVVVAESFEAAREAAALVRLEYDERRRTI